MPQEQKEKPAPAKEAAPQDPKKPVFKDFASI